MIGVKPADECLGAHQAAILQIDLRLVKQLEFVPCHSRPQFGLEPESRFKFGSDVLLKKHVRTAPGLRPIERKVRIAKKVVCRAAVFRKDRDTDADLDAALACANGKRELAE